MNNNDWFDVDDKGIVRLRNEAKAIPEVKELLKNKQSDKYWQYIWHLCSHKSPYSAHSEAERESKVNEDFLKELATQPLSKAVEKYLQSLETTSMRLLRAAKKAALSIAEYLENASTRPDPESIGDVVDTLGKIGKIIESLDKLEDKVKKEITNDEKIRGGGLVRSRER